MSKIGSTKAEARPLRGVVAAYNYSPKGEPDGVILDDSGTTFQVNVPPHHWAEFSRDAAIGRTVDLSVEIEPATETHPEGDHPAFKLVAPKPGEGHTPPHHDHDHGEPATVTGTVARLNYAKHGEANGVVLDSGDFVHLKPDGMKQAGLKVGQEVTAEGGARALPGGHRAIEARAVNGRALKK